MVPLGSAIQFLLSILALIYLAAIVVFCSSMMFLCETNHLPRAAGSWRFTRLLFILIIVVPIGLVYFAGMVAMLGGTSFRLNLGPAGLVLLPVFATPVIHLFVSTSRMKSEVLGH